VSRRCFRHSSIWGMIDEVISVPVQGDEAGVAVEARVRTSTSTVAYGA
jgi:hypothetical protein